MCQRLFSLGFSSTSITSYFVSSSELSLTSGNVLVLNHPCFSFLSFERSRCGWKDYLGIIIHLLLCPRAWVEDGFPVQRLLWCGIMKWNTLSLSLHDLTLAWLMSIFAPLWLDAKLLLNCWKGLSMFLVCSPMSLLGTLSPILSPLAMFSFYFLLPFPLVLSVPLSF